MSPPARRIAAHQLQSLHEKEKLLRRSKKLPMSMHMQTSHAFPIALPKHFRDKSRSNGFHDPRRTPMIPAGYPPNFVPYTDFSPTGFQLVTPYSSATAGVGFPPTGFDEYTDRSKAVNPFRNPLLFKAPINRRKALKKREKDMPYSKPVQLHTPLDVSVYKTLVTGEFKTSLDDSFEDLFGPTPLDTSPSPKGKPPLHTDGKSGKTKSRGKISQSGRDLSDRKKEKSSVSSTPSVSSDPSGSSASPMSAPSSVPVGSPRFPVSRGLLSPKSDFPAHILEAEATKFAPKCYPTRSVDFISQESPYPAKKQMENTRDGFLKCDNAIDFLSDTPTSSRREKTPQLGHNKSIPRRRSSAPYHTPPGQSHTSPDHHPPGYTPGYNAGYNTPNYNTPNYNTPNYNTPNYNTPNYNTPNYNAPGYNTSGNTPNYNTSGNTPNYNTPNYNTPNYNTPNYNTPNYNTSGNSTPGNMNSDSYGFSRGDPDDLDFNTGTDFFSGLDDTDLFPDVGIGLPGGAARQRSLALKQTSPIPRVMKRKPVPMKRNPTSPAYPLSQFDRHQQKPMSQKRKPSSTSPNLLSERTSPSRVVQSPHGPVSPFNNTLSPSFTKVDNDPLLDIGGFTSSSESHSNSRSQQTNHKPSPKPPSSTSTCRSSSRSPKISPETIKSEPKANHTSFPDSPLFGLSLSPRNSSPPSSSLGFLEQDSITHNFTTNSSSSPGLSSPKIALENDFLVPTSNSTSSSSMFLSSAQQSRHGTKRYTSQPLPRISKRQRHLGVPRRGTGSRSPSGLDLTKKETPTLQEKLSRTNTSPQRRSDHDLDFDSRSLYTNGTGTGSRIGCNSNGKGGGGNGNGEKDTTTMCGQNGSVLWQEALQLKRDTDASRTLTMAEKGRNYINAAIKFVEVGLSYEKVNPSKAAIHYRATCGFLKSTSNYLAAKGEGHLSVVCHEGCKILEKRSCLLEIKRIGKNRDRIVNQLRSADRFSGDFDIGDDFGAGNYQRRGTQNFPFEADDVSTKKLIGYFKDVLNVN